jgi:hypothetical protein
LAAFERQILPARQQRVALALDEASIFAPQAACTPVASLHRVPRPNGALHETCHREWPPGVRTPR